MFKDLVKKSRSFRGYDESVKLTKADLEEFVDHVRYAPSAVNKQPLKYYLAWEEDEVKRIQSLVKMGAALPELHLPRENERPTAFIVICHDSDIIKINNNFLNEVGIVAQTILLAAAEKGLGGCMIGNFSPAKMSEALGLGENLIPSLVLALGKPAEKIVLVEIEDGDNTNYYRDENDVHYVPKRKLKDIILTRDQIK